MEQTETESREGAHGITIARLRRSLPPVTHGLTLPSDPPPANAGVIDPDTGKTQTADASAWGTYTDNLGYKIVNTDKGDANLSLYYVCAIPEPEGNRSDLHQLVRANLTLFRNARKFSSSRCRSSFSAGFSIRSSGTFVYAWSSNATQGQAAQVVLAGNLNYTFTDWFTLGGRNQVTAGHPQCRGQFPLLAECGQPHGGR